MMFDNTPEPTQSTWATVKAHLPIVMLVGGAIALFIGLHTAATAVLAVAVGHVVLALVALGGRWLYRRRNGAAA